MAGRRLAKLLKALAAAYRGDLDSKFLPAPHVSGGLWPWHIAELLPQLPAGAAAAGYGPEARALMMRSQV